MDNLVRDYGCSWQRKEITPIEFEKIRHDPYFLTALDRSHVTIGAHEMIANVELSFWLMNYHEHSTEYSSEFQMIEEPQQLPTAQNRNMIEKNSILPFVTIE